MQTQGNENLTRIAQALKDAFPNAKALTMENVGACNGDFGLVILVVDESFQGISLLKRHQ
jgi:stress-induced morphogen